jgi:hypothetical protein
MRNFESLKVEIDDILIKNKHEVKLEFYKEENGALKIFYRFKILKDRINFDTYIEEGICEVLIHKNNNQGMSFYFFIGLNSIIEPFNSKRARKVSDFSGFDVSASELNKSLVFSKSLEAVDDDQVPSTVLEVINNFSIVACSAELPSLLEGLVTKF